MSTPVEITPASLADRPLPDPEGESDKNSRGLVLVLGGVTELAGATLLSGVAALRAGAGKLRFVAPERYAVALALQVPEARVMTGAADAEGALDADGLSAIRSSLEDAAGVVVGPGALVSEAAGRLALSALTIASRASFVVDAAAMTGLVRLPSAAAACRGRAVLTPHAGEFATMTDCDVAQVRAEPARLAREWAERWNSVVVLKGQRTHVASPDGRVWRNSAGVRGLGVSGSGDVLAGVIAGLLARGADPATAAIWGVYVHAQAGRALSTQVAPEGFLAREILDRIPGELLAARA